MFTASTKEVLFLSWSAFVCLSISNILYLYVADSQWRLLSCWLVFLVRGYVLCTIVTILKYLNFDWVFQERSELTELWLEFGSDPDLTISDTELEALRERRPPWPRQIITSILPNVKMLSIGGERLRFWINTYTMIWLCYCYYGVFCSFSHLKIPRSPPKFTQSFIVLPSTSPENFIPIRL